jgi:hypothetical protein
MRQGSFAVGDGQRVELDKAVALLGSLLFAAFPTIMVRQQVTPARPAFSSHFCI